MPQSGRTQSASSCARTDQMKVRRTTRSHWPSGGNTSRKALLAGIWMLAAQYATSADPGRECRACHPEAVANYLQTGMGNSIRPATLEMAGEFEHGYSGSSFRIVGSAEGMRQSVERDGAAGEYPIEHVIGSGNAAFGFLVRIGDYLYQSPVSYYTKRGRWDMAPGFERHPAPDFDRPVLNECVWCHAGRPNPVAGTQNRYGEPALHAKVISCDRCHGPAADHLAVPSAETIVNPAKLPPERRDSVCEQCHLGGEERVLNPGRTFGDFQPGMLLEEVFSVYLDDFGGLRAGRFKVVSHAEQLKLSKCHQASGEDMWCGTCHDPHAPEEAAPDKYGPTCMGCHQEGVMQHHPPRTGGCVDCHMVRRPSFDSGHSAFTDHRIARIPTEDGGSGPPAERIRAWREPASPSLAQRNAGLAYLRLGRRRGRDDFMDEGASLLARLAQRDELDAEGLEELGSALLAKRAPPEAGLTELAKDLLARALQTAPNTPARLRTMAAAEWQTGNVANATDLLHRAIALDPQNRAAYQVLARIHEERGDTQGAVEVWEGYLQHVGQSLFARHELESLRRRQRTAAP